MQDTPSGSGTQFDEPIEMFPNKDKIVSNTLRYPHCIVWTPIPLLT